MPAHPVETPPNTKFLRCHVCERILPCPDAELVEFVGNGWPVCCDQTMALYVEAVPPRAPRRH